MNAWVDDVSLDLIERVFGTDHSLSPRTHLSGWALHSAGGVQWNLVQLTLTLNCTSVPLMRICNECRVLGP